MISEAIGLAKPVASFRLRQFQQTGWEGAKEH
jgi:hypothetical protein